MKHHESVNDISARCTRANPCCEFLNIFNNPIFMGYSKYNINVNRSRITVRAPELSTLRTQRFAPLALVGARVPGGMSRVSLSTVTSSRVTVLSFSQSDERMLRHKKRPPYGGPERFISRSLPRQVGEYWKPPVEAERTCWRSPQGHHQQQDLT